MFFAIFTKTIEKHKENQKNGSEALRRLSGHSLEKFLIFLIFLIFLMFFAIFTETILANELFPCMLKQSITMAIQVHRYHLHLHPYRL